MSSPNLKEVQKQISTWKLSRESPSAAAPEDLKTAVVGLLGIYSLSELSRKLSLPVSTLHNWQLKRLKEIFGTQGSHRRHSSKITI